MAEIFGESRGTPNFDQSTIFLQPVWIRDPATNAFRFSRLETGPGNERSVCTPSRGGMRTERVKDEKFDPNPRLRTHRNALEIACCEGNLEIVHLLITNRMHPANPNTRDQDDNSPFETALFSENLELVALLLEESIKPVDLDYIDNDGNCALSHAIDVGNVSLVEVLLNAGADVNLNTSLLENSPMVRAIQTETQSKGVPICKLLLEYGFDLNQGFYYELNLHYTVINLAAWWGNIHIVKLLHEKGADLLKHMKAQ